VRHKPRINVLGHAIGIIGQCHGGTAHDEHVRDDTPAGKTLA